MPFDIGLKGDYRLIFLNFENFFNIDLKMFTVSLVEWLKQVIQPVDVYYPWPTIKRFGYKEDGTTYRAFAYDIKSFLEIFGVTVGPWYGDVNYFNLWFFHSTPF